MRMTLHCRQNAELEARRSHDKRTRANKPERGDLVGKGGVRLFERYLEDGRFCPYLSMPSRRIFDSSV